MTLDSTGARTAASGIDTIRVLQLGPLYNNHLRRWAEHAASFGCTVWAAGHVRPGRRQVDLSDVAESVAVAPYGQGTSADLAWLRALLRRLRPDLVHAHWLPGWGHLASSAGGGPVLATAWGSDIYLAIGADRRRADQALRQADGVLARSHHMRDEMLARGAPARRVHTVDLGVDLGAFRPATPGEQEQLRRELGLPSGPLILSLRAGTELYNLDVVLDAFAAVRERVPDTSLALACGDAPFAEGVRARLDALRPSGAVRVLHPADHSEMPRLLRAATVGISIPSSDGSPSSVWEALASGLPTVVSDLPQIEEKVGGAGAAVLAEPRSDPVTEALTGLLTDPDRRGALGTAARAWAEREADQRDQRARLRGVYSLLVAARERGVEHEEGEHQ